MWVKPPNPSTGFPGEYDHNKLVGSGRYHCDVVPPMPKQLGCSDSAATWHGDICGGGMGELG